MGTRAVSSAHSRASSAASPYALTPWEVSFLDPLRVHHNALIILNQPFSFPLLDRVWHSSRWHACADGGANRLHDLLKAHDGKDKRHLFTPDLIKGDLDSIRDDVRAYYASRGVRIVRDDDQDSTDLMKCIAALVEDEKAERHVEQNTIVILGGLSGRLDQTVHTLSLVHKLRRSRKRTFVISDDNVAWLLDAGEHRIHVDHALFGPTCGLLPVGIDATVLTTTGLRWNLTDHVSCFDGMVSTSNHLLPEEPVVSVKTTKPIWWTMELRPLKPVSTRRTSIDERGSVDGHASVEGRGSVDRRASVEGRASLDGRASVGGRASVDGRASVERRNSAEERPDRAEENN